MTLINCGMATGKSTGSPQPGNSATPGVLGHPHSTQQTVPAYKSREATPLPASSAPVPTAVYFNTDQSVKLPQIAAEPAQRSKTIYLIRHGEGWHNIGYDHNLDPHLTPRGWAQTAALQQHLAALQPQLDIELVIVSPLRRTLETAAGVFGAANPPPMQAAAAAATLTAAASAVGNGGASPADQQPPGCWTLMKPQPDKPYEITSRQQIFLPPITAAAAAAAAAISNDSDMVGHEGSNHVHKPLPLVAHEGCRERIGPNVCDKFRDLPLQTDDFPGVDFSLIRHHHDVEWERVHDAICHDCGCYLTGEEETAVERRAVEFYKWIMSRSERRIAVVSHCGFLCHGMRALGKAMLQVWNEAMMEQCNMQAAEAASPLPDCNNKGTRGGMLDVATAEAVRVDAGGIAGRMSADWMNCEMRSIQLCWGPDLSLGQHDSRGNASTGHKAVDECPSKGNSCGWLWAVPGDGNVWFPGGFYGI